MSKYDSQTPLAHQSWLSHTQKQQDYRCQALRQCINCSHTVFCLPFVYGTVWISHIQMYFQVFDYLITEHIWLPAGNQALTTLELLPHTQMTQKGTEVPSYETKTAVSHRLISLTGILANRRRTNCCWIFSHGQDVHNIMQSLWMLGRGSERPTWFRPQGHLAQ